MIRGSLLSVKIYESLFVCLLDGFSGPNVLYWLEKEEEEEEETFKLSIMV